MLVLLFHCVDFVVIRKNSSYCDTDNSDRLCDHTHHTVLNELIQKQRSLSVVWIRVSSKTDVFTHIHILVFCLCFSSVSDDGQSYFPDNYHNS